MPATKYQRLKKLIGTLDKSRSYHLDEIKSLIRMHVATTEKLVIESVRQLVEFGFIREIEPFKFQVVDNGTA